MSIVLEPTSTSTQQQQSSRRPVSFDFIFENAALRHANPYVDRFCSFKLLSEKRDAVDTNQQHWRSILNKTKIKKECSEAMAIVAHMEALISSLSNTAYQRQQHFVVIDLCSGKGFTGLALHCAMIPSLQRIVMVDKNVKTKYEHLKDLPSLLFQRVVFTKSFDMGNLVEDIVQKFRKDLNLPDDEEVVVLLSAMHLCTWLAEVAIAGFLHTPCVKGLVLCPCCSYIHEVNSQYFEGKQQSQYYESWSEYLENLLRSSPALPNSVRVTRGQDEHILSDKNIVITALKKTST